MGARRSRYTRSAHRMLSQRKFMKNKLKTRIRKLSAAGENSLACALRRAEEMRRKANIANTKKRYHMKKQFLSTVFEIEHIPHITKESTCLVHRNTVQDDKPFKSNNRGPLIISIDTTVRPDESAHAIADKPDEKYSQNNIFEPLIEIRVNNVNNTLHQNNNSIELEELKLVTIKKCLMKFCLNTSENCSDLLFVEVPREPLKRLHWFGIAQSVASYHTNECYCCEDHFFKTDFDNYATFKPISGFFKLKPGIVPHRNLLPNTSKRAAVNKGFRQIQNGNEHKLE